MTMFPVRKYGAVLDEMAKARGIETLFGTELVAVNGPARRATFRDIKTGAPPTAAAPRPRASAVPPRPVRCARHGPTARPQ
jgi:hypothetical protein